VSVRLAVIAGWLLAGHALLLALFWGLLHIPESSIWMLALSAVAVVLLVAGAAGVHAGALAAWQQDGPIRRTLLTGIRHAPAFLAATLLFWAIWLATAHALDWHAEVAGQIDAIHIVRTGSPGTDWLHAIVFWTVQFVRWPLGLTLALTLFAALIRGGAAALRGTGWLRAALRPTRWLAVAFWLVLLIALPLQAVDWRPQPLALVLEPWFVAAKLGLIAAAAALGWALVLRTCART
jgi:hypothetical protein